MGTISVTELRADLRKTLARVEAGEVLEITRDGNVIAVMTHPSIRRRTRTRALLAAEKFHEEMENARHQPLPPVGAISKERAEEMVRELRAERDRDR